MPGFQPKITLALGVCLGLSLCLWLFDFTVDDALISVRYAHNLAIGLGSRFNPTDAPSDGVTPILWHRLLALFPSVPALATLKFAKILGVLTWLAAASWLGLRIAPKNGNGFSQFAILALFSSPNLAAWSVSGMETGLSTSIATSAVLLLSAAKPNVYLGALLLGLLPTFRPECLPWALCLSLGTTVLSPRKLRPWIAPTSAVILTIAPFLATCLYRLATFGNVSPLSVRAKPSDLEHGLIYTAASLLLLGLPLACLAPRLWTRCSRFTQLILAAFSVHCLAIVAVGGDWMPMSRLFMPVLPSLALALAEILDNASLGRALAALSLCLAGQGFVAYSVGLSASRVGKTRASWVEELGPRIVPSDVLACVDIGWVSAAHPGKIVDLAGVTDPWIAALPGGHTSKAIPTTLLSERGVSKLLLMLPKGYDSAAAWKEGYFARTVESRLARQPFVRDNFEWIGDVGKGEYRYGIFAFRGPKEPQPCVEPPAIPDHRQR